MQANQTYPIPPSWNSLSHSNSDSGLNCFSQLSCGRWICKETGDSETESSGRKDGKEPTGEMRERVERRACGEDGWEGCWLGNITGIWG